MRTTRRGFALGISAGALISATPALAQERPARPLSNAALDAAVAPESRGPDGQPRPVIQLWPRNPPGPARQRPLEVILERSTPPALRDRAVTHTSRPVLIVFKPANPNGAALLMCPGGGYARCVLDKESYESSERFNAAGVTTFILVYRLPGDQWAAGPDVSLHDAQRAIRLIRARSSEFGVDPHKVAVMGFSAGGHVAGSLTLRWDAPSYARVDAVDDQPTKPDASLLLYPVVSMVAPYGERNAASLFGPNGPENQRRARSLELIARPDAPPTFIAAAADDDTIPIENSIMLYDALRAAHVPSELHVFETGGHGFGLRFTPGKPTESWPQLALNFMRTHQLLGT